MKSPLSFGCNGVHPGRRDFLRVGSLSLLGIHLSQFLAARRALASPGTEMTGKAQACILLYLDGGPSQIDTWDPKPKAPAEATR